jgi:predicted RNA-binding protein with PIN domain
VRDAAVVPRQARPVCRRWRHPARDNDEMSDPRPVLVVDAANVMGSWPDGWWRDRRGAATRLRDALEPLANDHEVILVVEGRARGVEPTDRIDVVAAPGSGDDEIVRIAAAMTAQGRRVIVVTADRELRQRLTETGAEVAGPRTLPYTGRK